MSKVNKWTKKMDEYYEGASRDQLFRDSRKAGIVLRPVDQGVKYVLGTHSKVAVGKGRRIAGNAIRQPNHVR
ncbi:hypothetical protein [Ammoniphilus sp. YIM 78166]|uniref:hypothetical protein n=1 Tax=Ammoniphilus sp. YIM 78166 TaxID=1644106 RepID=UPI00106FD21A|nr:hypothetical protein [Ammoniphilus sp. YIM 78166]